MEGTRTICQFVYVFVLEHEDCEGQSHHERNYSEVKTEQHKIIVITLVSRIRINIFVNCHIQHRNYSRTNKYYEERKEENFSESMFVDEYEYRNYYYY